MPSDAARPAPRYLPPGKAYEDVGAQVAGATFRHGAQRRWLLAFLASLALLGLLLVCVGWLFYSGVGVWGNNIPVSWALDITAYDWWMGIASGALLVSASLLLLGQTWRSALNRIAESTALYAACAAAVYPIIHLGRWWFFYWNLPYPNSLWLWPQFRSPLAWDAMAILSYLAITVLFWSVAMLPDLGALRDRAEGYWRQRAYGVMALGWRGSAVHWARWLQAYRVLALLAVLVVISLQSGAALMYSGSVEPGWHDTLLPAFYLITAAFSGLAAIGMGAAVARGLLPLSSLITDAHLDIIGRLLIGAGLLATYCYAADFLFTAYGGDAFDRAASMRRLVGPYAWSFWAIVLFALLPIHLLWFRRMRRSGLVLFAVGVLVLAGMWCDRFMSIVVTLQYDFLPPTSYGYAATFWSIGTFAGSIGLFATMWMLFLRYLPAVSITELRLLAREEAEVAVDG